LLDPSLITENNCLFAGGRNVPLPDGYLSSLRTFTAVPYGIILALTGRLKTNPAMRKRHMKDGKVARGGRQLRLGLSVIGGAIAMLAMLGALVLSMHSQASTDWLEFSIGPASGKSASIGPGRIRSDGITLKGALATAYDMPAVRVIGPAWLAETRYSINAVVDVDESESFRPLLRKELKNRLRLETHVDVRPFAVFVLTATDAPRLERAHGKSVSVWIHERDVRLQHASMERLASALQSILGKPVIDETGITGSYNLEFGWGDDRVASVTATLRDRFGLRLTSGKRDLEALIVDDIRRDAALVLLAQIGRVTSAAPPALGQRIAHVLKIH
jgi:uncharacterized protein (TIGR03435 family)